MHPRVMLLFYLVLTFGWLGSPGEWMVWAWAAILYLQHWSPRLPSREGPERFRAWALMDDTILVEPVLGLRPWLAARAYETGAVKLFGKGGINESKKEEEGAFAERQTVWGVDMDTASTSASLPENRILKGAYLLSDPVYDPGNRCIRLIDMQRLRGTGQSWAIVIPQLLPELRVLDMFLGPPGGPRNMSRTRSSGRS